MAGNTIGKIFRVTTFGESHGNAIGAIIDGCPSCIKINIEDIQAALDRRKPGAKINGSINKAVSSRVEEDKVEILSGVFDNVTEGTPISLVIKNSSQKSKDYSNLKNTFRPGHADFSYFKKYGFRDFRGGGRASGRETASRVAAGAIANELLKIEKIKVTAYTISVAGINCSSRDLSVIEQNSLRSCDLQAAKKMEEKVEQLRSEGNSCGGIIECVVSGMVAGLGEPVFDKLDAELSKAIMSIGAIKGIEFGLGFESTKLTGKENNDQMCIKNNDVSFLSNNAGGIIGGISNGNDIVFRVAVKPVPSIFQKQKTISIEENTYSECDLIIEGRHDICLCPRIVPVIEAMTQIVIADMILRQRCAKVN